MRSRLSAMRLSSNSKNLNVRWLKMLCSHVLARRSTRKSWMSGRTQRLSMIKRSTSIDSRISPYVIDLPLRRRFLRRKNNLLMVFILSILNNSKLKTRLLMRKSKSVMRSCSNLGLRLRNRLSWLLIPGKDSII